MWRGVKVTGILYKQALMYEYQWWTYRSMKMTGMLYEQALIDIRQMSLIDLVLHEGDRHVAGAITYI